jgi:mono/diheme cytochrome c family protein
MNRLFRSLRVGLLAALSTAAFLAILFQQSLSRAAASPAPDIKDVYLDKCSVCHGDDGRAKTAKGKKVKAKDFHADDVQKLPEKEMLDAIAKGKGKNMDGFEKELSKEQIQQLVKYCRDLGKP